MQYMLARRLLTGRALADFNNAVTLHIKKSLENYIRCIQAVTLGFFCRKFSKTRRV